MTIEIDGAGKRWRSPPCTVVMSSTMSHQDRGCMERTERPELGVAALHTFRAGDRSMRNVALALFVACTDTHTIGTGMIVRNRTNGVRSYSVLQVHGEEKRRSVSIALIATVAYACHDSARSACACLCSMSMMLDVLKVIRSQPPPHGGRGETVLMELGRKRAVTVTEYMLCMVVSFG